MLGTVFWHFLKMVQYQTKMYLIVEDSEEPIKSKSEFFQGTRHAYIYTHTDFYFSIPWFFQDFTKTQNIFQGLEFFSQIPGLLKIFQTCMYPLLNQKFQNLGFVQQHKSKKLILSKKQQQIISQIISHTFGLFNFVINHTIKLHWKHLLLVLSVGSI